jgi:hypothetical protein
VRLVRLVITGGRAVPLSSVEGSNGGGISQEGGLLALRSVRVEDNV